MVWLLRFLPAAFCMGGMALCMWMMSRGHRKTTDNATEKPAPDRADVGELHDEVARLRAELHLRDQQTAE